MENIYEKKPRKFFMITNFGTFHHFDDEHWEIEKNTLRECPIMLDSIIAVHVFEDDGEGNWAWDCDLNLEMLKEELR